MRKIISIGESVLDTVFFNNQPVKAMVGGRIANATASLGMTGVPVTFCSECCTDSVLDNGATADCGCGGYVVMHRL